jgi:UDP:flavonoid glycosyltransferase YjiC (YdhE family)
VSWLPVSSTKKSWILDADFSRHQTFLPAAIQPYLALGGRLQKAGHTVCLAAPHRFADLAAQYSIPYSMAGQPNLSVRNESGLAKAPKSCSIRKSLRKSSLALRAGLPNIVIPHGIDQWFWGKRIAAMGQDPPRLA